MKFGLGRALKERQVMRDMGSGSGRGRKSWAKCLCVPVKNGDFEVI